MSRHARRPWSLMTCAIALSVAAVTMSCHSQPSTQSLATPGVQASPDLGAATFAFTTATSLSLVRAGAIAASVTTSSEPRYPVFTHRARFVAAATGQQVVVLGFGQSRTFPSSTTQVFASSADTVMWWEAPNQLVSLDADNPTSTPSRDALDVPPGSNLVGVLGVTSVLAEPDPQSPQNPPLLVSVGSDRVPHPLGQASDTTPIGVTVPNPYAPELAYTNTIHAACPRNAVNILDARATAVASPPMPFSSDNNATVRRLWWDSDGLLHISVAQKPCQDTADSAPIAWSNWKLDHGTWSSAEPQGTLVSRQLGNATVAVTASQSTPPAGTLSITNNGKNIHIADGVTDLATPPGKPD